MEFPLEFGQVSPGPDFTLMELGKRPDGLRDGVHCGGVWLSPDKSTVYKPLDAKPYQNADCRIPTDEDRCLAEMAGTVGFPENWRVEETNGRRWLVRPRCYLWPQEKGALSPPKTETYRMIIDALRAMNAAGWEYGDTPQLAYDPNIYEWFLLDCSAAFKPSSWGYDSGDEWRVPGWLDLVNVKWLAALWRRGQHLHGVVQVPVLYPDEARKFRVLDVFYPCTDDERQRYHYIYASRSRPMSTLWARISGPEGSKGARYIDGEMGEWPAVHSWAVSDFPLDEETIARYELTPAYRPWNEEGEHDGSGG